MMSSGQTSQRASHGRSLMSLGAGLIAGLTVMTMSCGVLAQGSFGVYTNSSILSGRALSSVSGVSTTNMAAGDGNIQSSSGSISMGTYANAASTLQQQSWIGERLSSQQQNIGIKDRAYQRAEGWLSVNQAAGHGNVQSNSFNVALGISASSLNDTSLQQVLADTQALNGDEDPIGKTSRQIEIDSTAFVDARGVVQVNQSAGTGNATRNSFGMTMSLSP